ncbi:MAG: cellulase family glycosylhydrolase [Salinivirgaceae bacterium]|jgi:endoglucanase|nr:cellulase family glycosylhydrolase [Salinivirgaceae bacterium]
MKNIYKIFGYSFLIIAYISVYGCNKEEGSDEEEGGVKEPIETFYLTVNPERIVFQQESDSASITIDTDAPTWNLTTDADWLQLSQTDGITGTSAVNIRVAEYAGTNTRSTSITITADEADTIKVTITQNGGLYPSYNLTPKEPDASGMSNSAEELAAKIQLGWNIGNSLEATGGETSWGNPKITKNLIDLVKQNGFNAIRIPCAWDGYMANSETAELKTDWLNRAKEVVQYCVDNDMYVLLNIHWDGGWLENNCTADKQEENNAKQKAFWQQIATHMRDFDEHLLFASANEPNVDDANQMLVLNSYHQTFIDAVRSTGGKNSYRTLVVQGPSTDIDKTNNLMRTLPTDEIANRLMAEIHFYTPWNFCGLDKDESWGSMFYYWGEGYHSTTDTDHNANWGEEDAVDALFKKMKNQFIDKGIPVIMGEYGAIRRSDLTGDALTDHLASRAYYLKYVTKQAKTNGLLPFYWDNGGTGNNSFGIFDRNTNTVFDQQALDALVEGATE